MRKILRKKASIILVAASLGILLPLLAGCGSDSGTQGANNSVSSAASERTVAESGGTSTGSIDACTIVTQADATKLFGNPASKDEGAQVLDPSMLGECLWSYDTETSSQLLQFRIWGSDQYYGPPSDAQPLAIGDQGSIRINSFAGVDIEWIQDGKTINLSFSTVGTGVPDATTKAEDLKAMAKEISGKL